MIYPCIRYEFSGTSVVYADNGKYITHDRYLITHISTDTNDPAAEALENFLYSDLDRIYTKDGLVHSVFTIYI